MTGLINKGMKMNIDELEKQAIITADKAVEIGYALDDSQYNKVKVKFNKMTKQMSYYLNNVELTRSAILAIVS